jgi:hypothetical protein
MIESTSPFCASPSVADAQRASLYQDVDIPAFASKVSFKAIVSC